MKTEWCGGDGTVAYGAGGPICRVGVIVAAVREGGSREDDGTEYSSGAY